MAARGVAKEPDREDQASWINEGMLVTAGDGDGLVPMGDGMTTSGAAQEVFPFVTVLGLVLPDTFWRQAPSAVLARQTF